MGKRVHLYPPLAKWSGSLGGKVRLNLSALVVQELVRLLESVAGTANAPLDSAANVGRRQAQVLACELLARPAIWNHYGRVDAPLRLTVTHSVALALLAWLLSSPTTNEPTHPLRPLLNTLHQLLQ